MSETTKPAGKSPEEKAAEKAAKEEAKKRAAEEKAAKEAAAREKEEADKKAAEERKAKEAAKNKGKAESAHEKYARAVLKDHPSEAEVHITGDGFAFFRFSDARNHAATLKDNQITTITRE